VVGRRGARARGLPIHKERGPVVPPTQGVVCSALNACRFPEGKRIENSCSNSPVPGKVVPDCSLNKGMDRDAYLRTMSSNILLYNNPENIFFSVERAKKENLLIR